MTTNTEDQEYENIRKIYIDSIMTERKLSRDIYFDEEIGKSSYDYTPADTRRQDYRDIAFKVLEEDETTDNQLDKIKERIIADFSNKKTLQSASIIDQITNDKRDIDTLENFINLLSDFFDNNVTRDTELMKSVFEQVKKKNTKITTQREKNIREIMKNNDVTYDEVIVMEFSDIVNNYNNFDKNAKQYVDGYFTQGKEIYRINYKTIKEKYNLTDSDMKIFNYLTVKNYSFMPEVVERVIADKIRK